MNSTVADATHPVQMQLEAYNARDIDSFMQWWSDDCLYYAFPDTLLASGTDGIRERHVERFREPDLHGTLLNRLSVGNMVIDHETVRRTFAEGVGEIVGPGRVSSIRSGRPGGGRPKTWRSRLRSFRNECASRRSAPTAMRAS